MLEGTHPYVGWYIIEVDHPGVYDSTFNPDTTSFADATRFVVYSLGGSDMQLQSQHRNQWVASADHSAGPGDFVAIDDPMTFQYRTNSDQTVQFLSDGWAYVTIAGGVPTTPVQDPWIRLVWLAQFAAFPVTTHVVVPSLPQIQASKQCPNADFTNVILTGSDLSGVNLSGSTFTSAALGNVKLVGATLRAATLELQDLRSCALDGADLTDAHLEGANLSGLVLNPPTTFAGAHMAGANLSNAKLLGVDLTGADLSGAILTGADLTGAVMAGTNFSGTNLLQTTFGPNPKFSSGPSQLTSFSGATLDYSVIGRQWSYLDLTQATIENLPVDMNQCLQLGGLQAVSSNLTGMDLHNAVLRSGTMRTSFESATLIGANLSGTDCTQASFAGALLGGGSGGAAATLSRSTLFDADFSGAQMSGVNLSGAYLYGASATVSGATMPGVDLSNAYLTGLDLSNVRGKNMAGATFDGACLINCNLTGTTVIPDSYGKGGSFVAACLQGADFTDANLDGADLVDAGVSGPCSQPGTCTFPVTLTIRGQPLKLWITVNDAGTILPASATTKRTTCPNRDDGPCTGAMLISPRAPTAWPVTTSGREQTPGHI